MFSSAASGLFISVTWVNLCSSEKGTGCQWWTWQFWYSMANTNQALCFRAVSAGPTRGHQPIRPPSWSLFLIVWWPPGGHFAALAVLIMFLLTQRSRYRSSWWVNTLLSSYQHRYPAWLSLIVAPLMHLLFFSSTPKQLKLTENAFC